jgi:ATP-dependent RNA helicase DeaD
MTDVAFSAVPARLAETLAARGFTELTPIQEAALRPDLAGRDLRISSKTGSGKTVALGLILAAELEGPAAPRTGRDPAAPRVLIVAPTRELAVQLGGELAWLYARLPVTLAVVTGGTGLGGDFRALGAGPDLVIGTPGRLTDHVRRGSLALQGVRAVVLDEADEMLDMGFRDDLELLLSAASPERRTHMVSATFSREAMRLAEGYQRAPVAVQAEAGAANADIAHVGLLVARHERLAALINILLLEPEERTLVFVRTRVDAANLAADLGGQGFRASSLSGDLGQQERTATLGSFRAGAIRCLVATDIAARGLDISDVTHVVHFDLPDNGESLTHRSGRTGRAGKEGTSVLFVPPEARWRAEELCRMARVKVSWRSAPTPAAILERADERLIAELGAVETTDPRLRELAATLLDSGDPVGVVAALLAKSAHAGPCAPRHIRGPVPRPERKSEGSSHASSRPRAGGFVPFVVTYGAEQGATPSRVLALVCRRGGIRSGSIGAIRVAESHCTVEVASDVVIPFAKAAGRIDPRDPKVSIRPAGDGRAALALGPRRARA